MYKKILVPIDDSEASDAALAESIRVAQQNRGTLRLMHVVGIFLPTPLMVGGKYLDDLPRVLHAEGNRLLEVAKKKAMRHRVAVQTKLVDTVGGRAADLIVGEARKWKADLIVLGTHGR